MFRWVKRSIVFLSYAIGLTSITFIFNRQMTCILSFVSVHQRKKNQSELNYLNADAYVILPKNIPNFIRAFVHIFIA